MNSPTPISYSQLQPGKVYNRVYIGDNDAYARINGKITFRVIQTEPIMKAADLFCQFGHPLDAHLAGHEWTSRNLERAFQDYQIYEPQSEDEWFKKSARLSSVQEAVRLGYVDVEALKGWADWRGTCPFETYSGKTVSLSLSVQDKVPDQPLLQTVFIVWETWEKLRKDFQALGIERVR